MKYSRERQTELRIFDDIEATKVLCPGENNYKLFLAANREEDL
jgi:hypothetical protein